MSKLYVTVLFIDTNYIRSNHSQFNIQSWPPIGIFHCIAVPTRFVSCLCRATNSVMAKRRSEHSKSNNVCANSSAAYNNKVLAQAMIVIIVIVVTSYVAMMMYVPAY